MESKNEGARKGSILKVNSSHQHPAADHVKFDEEEIAEHDRDRGTRKIIDEAKTPYVHDDSVQEELINEDVVMSETGKPEVDAEIQQHLIEAEKNKELNVLLSKEASQTADFG